MDNYKLLYNLDSDMAPSHILPKLREIDYENEILFDNNTILEDSLPMKFRYLCKGSALRMIHVTMDDANYDQFPTPYWVINENDREFYESLEFELVPIKSLLVDKTRFLRIKAFEHRSSVPEKYFKDFEIVDRYIHALEHYSTYINKKIGEKATVSEITTPDLVFKYIKRTINMGDLEKNKVYHSMIGYIVHKDIFKQLQFKARFIQVFDI